MTNGNCTDIEWRTEFARRLKQSMDNAHMSASELSRRTSIGKSDISNYCKGKYLPKQDRVYLIASVLGVEPVWLYALETKYNGPRFTAEEVQHIVSTAPWDPEQMDYADKEDESIRIMTRGMQRMSPENRQKLLDVARVMFTEDFDEEGNKRNGRP